MRISAVKDKTLRKNRIKPPLADKFLIGVSLTLTLFWLLCLFFPIYWMVVSSFKDASIQYADPPEFGITVPDAYTLTVDYTDEQADELGSEGMYREANLMLWRMFGFKGSNIGRAVVTATVEGEPETTYSLDKADYQINYSNFWSKSVLLASDIDRVLPQIEEKGIVEVDEETAALPEKKNTNSQSEEMEETFFSDEDIVGEITGCSYCNSYRNFFDNYKIAWAYPNKLGLESGMFKPVLNTVYVAVMQFVLITLITSLAAYSLSKLLPRRLKGKIMIIIMASGMVPSTVTLIPKYQVIQSIGISDTLWAVILPTIAAFGQMLLFKGTFDAFPDSVLEAARIDGSGEIRLYFKFVLPSAMGVIGLGAITSFTSAWNDFFWPMMVLRDQEKYTVSLVLNILLNGSGSSPDYSTALALGFLISIPTLLIYAVFQKTLTYGFDFSGLKG